MPWEIRIGCRCPPCMRERERRIALIVKAGVEESHRLKMPLLWQDAGDQA